MNIQAAILTAIEDLKVEGIGELEAIAADYGIDAAVLRARFERAYPNGVMAPVDMTAKVEAEIVAQCARYGVSRTGVIGPVRAANGRWCYLIGRQGREVIAVCRDTALVRRMGLGNFTDASLRAQGIL